VAMSRRPGNRPRAPPSEARATIDGDIGAAKRRFSHD
jgi:hypothetical protein